MNIISQLDKAQEKQIPLYIEKWRARCLLTAPINKELFEQGLQEIHEELGMEAPREFLTTPVQSQCGAISKFGSPKLRAS